MKKRPVVFIGSSGEGEAIAKAVQANLDRVCEGVIWTQGVFGLGKGNLENLVGDLHKFDFAILILTPDDLVHSRGELAASPRDNLLLELGLFIGHLGRERTFAVYDRNANLKLPSDLTGVTYADYQLHSTGNLASSLGAACTKIENRINELEARNSIVTNARPTPEAVALIMESALADAKLPMFFTSNQLERVLACNQQIADLLGTSREKLKKEPVARLVERLVSLAPKASQAAIRQHQSEMADRFLAGEADYDSEEIGIDCRTHPLNNPLRGEWLVRIHAHRVRHNGEPVGFFVYYTLGTPTTRP
jgi:hypothetical protein